jgi:hypothetical protein
LRGVIGLLAAADESSGASFIVVPDTALILWTVFGAIVLLVIAFAIGRAGRARGQGFWVLFLASLVLSPIVGLLALWLLPRRPDAI